MLLDSRCSIVEGIVMRMKFSSMNLAVLAVTLLLTACGGGGSSSQTTNTSPVANVGITKSPIIGELVTLNGSASYDANSDPLIYSWTLTSVPNGSMAVLTNATSAVASFTADVAGTYVATLVVNDGKVNSTPASLTITAASAMDKTLQLARFWSIYTSDKQTLLAKYLIYSTGIVQSVNGWYVKGSNPNPYVGFPSWLDGTAVQAGFNTSTSKYYVIDMSAEYGFVWEFSFDSVGAEISGCRYRYPSGTSNKGACVQFWGS